MPLLWPCQSSKHDIGYSVYDAISHLRVNLTRMASAKGPVACALEKLTFFNIKAKLNTLSFPEPPPPKKGRNYCSNDSDDGAAEERSGSVLASTSRT